MKLTVLGMDPSLKNWGFSVGECDTDTGSIAIDRVGIFSPVKSTAKGVRQNSKDLERALDLSSNLFDLTNTVEPNVIFVEMPAGSQSARASTSYGICIGIISALKSELAFPLFEVTPTEVKIAAVNNRAASKNAMIEWATSAYPSVNWPTQKRSGITSVVAGKAEHMADAIGAIHAGVYKSDEFQKYLQILKQMKGVHHAS